MFKSSNKFDVLPTLGSMFLVRCGVLSHHTEEIAANSIATLKQSQVLEWCHEVQDLVVDNIPDLPVFTCTTIDQLLYLVTLSFLELLPLQQELLSHI